MPNWSAPQRPAAHAEESLISAILDRTYPPGSTLPGERELAQLLGVTRPTLRETLGRLECEGWLTIQHGKPTRVNDIWKEGGLAVLSALVRYSEQLPPDFVPNLLEVRLALAPAYARAAVEASAATVSAYLEEYTRLEDDPEAFAAFDWALHRTLTIASGNPVYTLILNGFAGFYEDMARLYFAGRDARASSLSFYGALQSAALRGDADRAERVTRATMQASLEIWRGARA